MKKLMLLLILSMFAAAPAIAADSAAQELKTDLKDIAKTTGEEIKQTSDNAVEAFDKDLKEAVNDINDAADEKVAAEKKKLGLEKKDDKSISEKLKEDLDAKKADLEKQAQDKQDAIESQAREKKEAFEGKLKEKIGKPDPGKSLKDKANEAIDKAASKAKDAVNK